MYLPILMTHRRAALFNTSLAHWLIDLHCPGPGGLCTRETYQTEVGPGGGVGNFARSDAQYFSRVFD